VQDALGQTRLKAALAAEEQKRLGAVQAAVEQESPEATQDALGKTVPGTNYSRQQNAEFCPFVSISFNSTETPKLAVSMKKRNDRNKNFLISVPVLKFFVIDKINACTK
jgi:hypothetical protein